MKRLAIVCALGLGLAALCTTPGRAAAAGCCQLPQEKQTSGAASTAEGFPLPFPFPIPLRGCFQTDSSELCEALGGAHYQLGICANGICQPTAAGADAAVFELDALDTWKVEVPRAKPPVKPQAD